MEAREYFDSVAEYWDSDYAYNYIARSAAALVSGAAQGAYVLDIGCGTGEMFSELIRVGASEITGVDLSPKMISFAEGKTGFDPRISLRCCDILDFDEGGFDVAIMFNAYQFVSDKQALLKKVHSLIRPGGRFTIAFGFGQERVNSYLQLVPEGLGTLLVSASEEGKVWENFFHVDILCDTPELYMISGTAREMENRPLF